MPAHKRVNWEFYAVVRGKAAPIVNRPESAPLVANSLWVFPPGIVHGWRGEVGKKCQVVVFHFTSVPIVLEHLALKQGFLSVRLAESERRSLVKLAAQLKPHYWNPVLLSEVYADRALQDLSLILLESFRESWHPQPTSTCLRKVSAAESWLSAHLGEQPTIRSAAQAAGISASQLRRLFLRVRKSSPKQVLKRLRFDAAMRVMAESDVKLQAVASCAGFSSASNFCRAFKHYNGGSPTEWRKETYVQYKRPKEANKGDYRQSGRRYREVL